MSQKSITSSDAVAEYVPNAFNQTEDDLYGTKNISQDDISKLLDDIGDRLTARLSASISTSIISQMSG